jgi:hypothetical protein
LSKSIEKTDSPRSRAALNRNSERIPRSLLQGSSKNLSPKIETNVK